MPRKTLKQRRRPTDDNDNRVRGVIDSFVGVETADDIMESLIGVLSEGGKIPTAGKYYTFFYNAKTPGIQYDQYPLVGVTEVFSWGFRGINFHWRDRRQYDYNQMFSGLYEIYPEEMSDVIELAFANVRSK
jgi:hypothetical protein